MPRSRRRTVASPVPASVHNAIMGKAQRRVDKLEGRLARVIQPLLEQAGDQAAERFTRLATNHLSAAAANSDVSTTATMVCVRPRPDEAAAIADPDGDPPDLLHVTLVYLGQVEDDQVLADAVEALRPVAAQFAPLEGVVGGYGLFDPAGVGVLLPDVRGLVELRVAVCEALLDAGIDYGRDHGFEAHITVHRDPTDVAQKDALERAASAPLHFDALCVVRGNEDEVEIPLVGVPALTADAGYLPPPAWTAPFPDEMMNVTAFVNMILERTDPVRKAMIEQTMTPALREAGLAFDVTNPLTNAVLASTASQVTGIAATTQLNLMQIIRSSYRNGLSIPQTASLIREGMKAASKTRATMIARTELARAVNGGSLAATQLVSSATDSKYDKRWETAPGAKYPRHEDYPELNGQIVPLDGAFTVGSDQLQYPGDPDGSPEETINCRCEAPWNRVSARPFAASRRTYEGQLVRVTTAAGRELSVTPNHPILARHGWVAAGLLEEGDEVVCRSRPDLASGCPDIDDVPTEAEERFAALELSAARRERIRGRSVNLHGEVPVGEVEVVWADDSLPLEDESPLGENLRELALSLTHREMGFDSDATTRLGIEESDPVRGGDIPTLDSCSDQDVLDGTTLYGEAAGEGELALAGAVSRDDLGRDSRVSVLERLPLRQRDRSADTPATKVTPDSYRSEAALVRDLVVTHPTLVEMDPVVDLARFNYAGHVYSFSTKTGAYISAGIVSGNCAMTYHTPEGGEETVDAETPPMLDTADAAGGGGGAGQITLPTDALSAHLTPLNGESANGLAVSLETRARMIEPALTDVMKASADANGAELAGLTHRLKSEESATRKIESDALDRHETVRETAYGVSDMVRYTALYEPGQYVAGTQRMLADLQSRGLRIVRFRNTWEPHAPYAGVNIQMAAANGYRFELQFHTPDSFALKNGIQHKLYEQWRKLPSGDPLRAELTKQMAANTDALTFPPGVNDLTYDLPGTSAELGVTPFRPEDDPIGFYNSTKYQQFIDQAATTANGYGVTIEGFDHMTGVWQGDTEPSIAIRAHDHEVGLQAFAANLGKAYEQDGVLVFGKGGGDIAARFPSASQEDALAALKNAGLDGGRLTTSGELEVLGQDTAEFRSQLAKVAAELGQPKVETGSFMLFENGEYQGLLDRYDAGKPLALQSPEQGIANVTSDLDPGGKDIDAALSSIGQQVSIPGRYDASDPVPVIEAKVVGNITVGGVNADGMFSPNDMTIEVRRLSDRYPTFTHEFGHAVDHLTATGIEAYATDTIEAVGLSDWYGAVKETPTYKGKWPFSVEVGRRRHG